MGSMRQHAVLCGRGNGAGKSGGRRLREEDIGANSTGVVVVLLCREAGVLVDAEVGVFMRDKVETSIEA
jgi:hypothetical protein